MAELTHIALITVSFFDPALDIPLPWPLPEQDKTDTRLAKRTPEDSAPLINYLVPCYWEKNLNRFDLTEAFDCSESSHLSRAGGKYTQASSRVKTGLSFRQKFSFQSYASRFLPCVRAYERFPEVRRERAEKTEITETERL